MKIDKGLLKNLHRCPLVSLLVWGCQSTALPLQNDGLFLLNVRFHLVFSYSLYESHFKRTRYILLKHHKCYLSLLWIGLSVESIRWWSSVIWTSEIELARIQCYLFGDAPVYRPLRSFSCQDVVTQQVFDGEIIPWSFYRIHRNHFPILHNACVNCHQGISCKDH